MRILILSILFIISTINTASAQENSISEPTVAEKLPQPIALTCTGMTVDEWRPDSHFPSITSPTKGGIDELNKICQFVIKRYVDFLNYKGFRYEQETLNVRISMLPANTLMDGMQERNLNDTSKRMKIAGPVCCNWGIWFRYSNRLFLRNDPIYVQNGQTIPNLYWERTFLHEMAHILNDQWHVMSRNYPGNKIRDEEIAEEWVSFLGIGYPTESSADDLKLKQEKK